MKAVVARAAIERVVFAIAKEQVITALTEDDICVVAAVDPLSDVGAIGFQCGCCADVLEGHCDVFKVEHLNAFKGICAIRGADFEAVIGEKPQGGCVKASVQEGMIGAAATVEAVAAGAACQGVIARPAKQGVCAPISQQKICAGGAGKVLLWHGEAAVYVQHDRVEKGCVGEGLCGSDCQGFGAPCQSGCAV